MSLVALKLKTRSRKRVIQVARMDVYLLSSIPKYSCSMLESTAKGIASTLAGAAVGAVSAATMGEANRPFSEPPSVESPPQ